jgi:hypothetical protein
LIPLTIIQCNQTIFGGTIFTERNNGTHAVFSDFELPLIHFAVETSEMNARQNEENDATRVTVATLLALNALEFFQPAVRHS